MAWLFPGGVAASLGRQLALVAAPIQVFALTESSLLVGLLGLSQFPAVLIGSTVGGTLSDAWDRRRVLIGAEATVVIVGAGLALNALLENPIVWVVFLLSSLQALVFSIDAPARMSTVPRLVASKRIPAAYALQVLSSQTAKAIGPILAGVIITVWSTSAAYWSGAAFGSVGIASVVLMSPLPATGGGTRPSLRSIGQGIRFLRKKKAIQGAFLIDINATVFGVPRALFPEMGISVFGGDATTVGLLFAAPGIGALVAAATSGWVGRVQRAGRATTIAVLAWGLMIAGVGISRSVTVALVFLALAGAPMPFPRCFERPSCSCPRLMNYAGVYPV